MSDFEKDLADWQKEVEESIYGSEAEEEIEAAEAEEETEK